MENFSLPIRYMLPTREISGESAATDFTGKKILLVEDNTLNEEIAKAILQDRGFVVDSAFDGTEAVAKMESSKGNEYC